MLHTDLCDLLGIEFPVIQVEKSDLAKRSRSRRFEAQLR